MKKLSIFFAIMLVVTGCSYNEQNNLKINEKNVSENMLTNNDSDTVNRINDIKNGATPKVKPKKESDNNKTNNNKMKNNNQQIEDLTKQYSQAILKTSLGDIVVKFYSADSPITVNNFLNLSKKGFYDNTKFHRIIKDFMIQAGDPLSKEDATASRWGTGGPGYKFQDEFNNHKLVKGSLAMANSGPNTNGSQFFIVTAEATSWLDGKHTNFGEVVNGMDIVEKIEASETGAQDRPLENIVINSIELMK